MGNYIGFDQALMNTGVAIYQPGAEPLVTLTTIKLVLENSVSNYHRLALLRRWLDYLVRKYEPVQVYTEAVYFNRITSYSMIPVEVQAVFKTQLYELGYESVPMNCGNQRDSWPNLTGLRLKSGAKRVLSQYGITINQHESDAFGVLYGGLIRDGVLNKEDIWKAKVIKKLIKNPTVPHLD